MRTHTASADASVAQDPSTVQPAPVAPANQRAQLPAHFPDDVSPVLRSLLKEHAVSAQLGPMRGALESPELEECHVANLAESATEFHAAIFEPAGIYNCPGPRRLPAVARVRAVRAEASAM